MYLCLLPCYILQRSSTQKRIPIFNTNRMFGLHSSGQAILVFSEFLSNECGFLFYQYGRLSSRKAYERMYRKHTDWKYSLPAYAFLLITSDYQRMFRFRQCTMHVQYIELLTGIAEGGIHFQARSTFRCRASRLCRSAQLAPQAAIRTPGATAEAAQLGEAWPPRAPRQSHWFWRPISEKLDKARFWSVDWSGRSSLFSIDRYLRVVHTFVPLY